MGSSFFISSEENKFLNQVSESNRKSFRIQPGKFPNPTGKVSESTRKSFRIQVSESTRKSFRIQPGKFPNPTGKVSESTRKGFRIQVSESTRKSFRRQRFSLPNPSCPNTQVPEYNRESFRIQPESFRIHPEKFPNPPGKVSEYKFPNPTRKVSEYNGDRLIIPIGLVRGFEHFGCCFFSMERNFLSSSLNSLKWACCRHCFNKNPKWV